MARYYHLSKKYLGDVVKLKPKVPGTSVITKEGNIPRVCFSINPFHCLRAICGHGNLTVSDLYDFIEDSIVVNPAMYTTDAELLLPPACSDFRFNNEHWSLKRIEVLFLGYLDLKALLYREIRITSNPNTFDMGLYASKPDIEIKHPLPRRFMLGNDNQPLLL